MTDNVPAIWQPTPFEGTDLLPIAMGQEKRDLTGREHIEQGDMILPSLAVLNGMSEAVTNQTPGAQPGKFFHSGIGEVIEGPMRVLLCAHTRSRSLFPKADRPEHAGLQECVSRDGKTGTAYGNCESCRHKEWTGETNRTPPACSESHNFTALTPLGPAIIRFARTSFKAARKMLTSWTMSSAPLFAHPAVIESKSNARQLPNGKMATYYSMDIRWLQRETVPPHVQDAARAIYEQVMHASKAGKFGTDAPEEPEDDNIPF